MILWELFLMFIVNIRGLQSSFDWYIRIQNSCSSYWGIPYESLLVECEEICSFQCLYETLLGLHIELDMLLSVYVIFKEVSFYHRLCPIFQVSNVSGDNLDLLTMFLNLLSSRTPQNDNDPAQFQIDDTYQVPVSCWKWRLILLVIIHY